MTDRAPKREGVAVFAFGLRGLTFELTPTAEAGGVSPVTDDATNDGRWAYDACRSGSGAERGVRQHTTPGGVHYFWHGTGWATSGLGFRGWQPLSPKPMAAGLVERLQLPVEPSKGVFLALGS